MTDAFPSGKPLRESSSPLRIGVVVATKGRSELIQPFIDVMGKQTRPPSKILISATEPSDVPAELNYKDSEQLICVFGPPGLCRQRNNGLALILSDVDVVVYFDDDFLPSPDWLEECAAVFSAEASIVGLDSTVVADGPRGRGIFLNDALHIIASTNRSHIAAGSFDPIESCFGCNMAFRVSAIGQERFDERLPLYAWLEDRDFSVRIARKGRLVRMTRAFGVHMGSHKGRISERRYGYSQIINAWYLWNKGSLSTRTALYHTWKALAANALKSIAPEENIDRRGRLVGNLIAFTELARFKCRPERVTEL